MLAYAARNPVQHLALLYAGRESPVIPRCVRSMNGCFSIFSASARDFIKRLFRRRVLNDKSLSRKAYYKLAVDEHFSHSFQPALRQRRYWRLAGGAATGIMNQQSTFDSRWQARRITTNIFH